MGMASPPYASGCVSAKHWVWRTDGHNKCKHISLASGVFAPAWWGCPHHAPPGPAEMKPLEAKVVDWS